MVGPSPPFDIAGDKAQLRRHYRALRREHVAGLPATMRGLLFMRPPVPVADRIAAAATVGLYHPHPLEAPTLAYARWLYENGRKLALPRFVDRAAPMAFHGWADPHDDNELEVGPFAVAQPRADTAPVIPQVLIIPLLAFTADGARLGQGGGHYDRWLAAHPETLTIGLAWDVQLAQSLPSEPHDHPLDLVVTPTRLYEGER
jgi:5-formyltetrahydrofolate cyclo-ligase